LQTEVKEEHTNLTINGKNYKTRAEAVVTTVTVNVGGGTNIPLTVMHGRMKVKLI